MRRLAALLAVGLVSPASAQDVLPRSVLTLTAADRAAHMAYDKCERLGFHVAVAVTDRDGELLALLRDQDGGVHLVDTARRKAFTAASSGAPTSRWEDAITQRSGVPDPNIGQVKDILAIGGGIPIMDQAHVIGAIGVAGSPGTNFDQGCAEAGAAVIHG